MGDINSKKKEIKEFLKVSCKFNFFHQGHLFIFWGYRKTNHHYHHQSALSFPFNWSRCSMATEIPITTIISKNPIVISLFFLQKARTPDSRLRNTTAQVVHWRRYQPRLPRHRLLAVGGVFTDYQGCRQGQYGSTA